MINGHGAQELCCSTCVPTHDALHQAAHPRRSPCAHTPQSGAASRLTRPASHGRASRRMSCTQELHGTLLLRVGCRDEPHDAKGSRRATSAPASLPSRLARPRPSGRRARARACSRSRCLRCAHRCQPRRRSSAPPEHACKEHQGYARLHPHLLPAEPPGGVRQHALRWAGWAWHPRRRPSTLRTARDVTLWQSSLARQRLRMSCLSWCK